METIIAIPTIESLQKKLVKIQNENYSSYLSIPMVVEGRHLEYIIKELIPLIKSNDPLFRVYRNKLIEGFYLFSDRVMTKDDLLDLRNTYSKYANSNVFEIKFNYDLLKLNIDYMLYLIESKSYIKIDEGRRIVCDAYKSLLALIRNNGQQSRGI